LTKAQRNLAIIFTIGFIVLTAAVMLLPQGWSAKLESPLYMVIGCWITNMTTIVNYNFGSSAGSKAKTDALMGKKPEVDPVD